MCVIEKQYITIFCIIIFISRLHKASHAPVADKLKAAQSERPLQTYNMTTTTSTACVDSGQEDALSTHILQQLHPIMLSEHYLVYVIGDGNCLYRAVSRALFGH